MPPVDEQGQTAFQVIERQAREDDHPKTPFKPPKYWAAFVLIGEPP